MIVILLKDIKGTGKSGDVVKVSDGYARNQLLPKGFAKEATDGNIRSLEKQKAIAEEKKAEQQARAEELAKQIGALSVTIQSKGGEGGRLFGSITSKDIAEALETQHNVKVDKKHIELDGPIKQTGTFSVSIKLYHGVTADLTVIVAV